MKAKEELPRLQAAKLPRLSWRDLFAVKEEGKLTAEDEAAMDAYFGHFVKTEGCVCCGGKQGGDFMDALTGAALFRWGIATGEGACSRCGYPARAMHGEIGPIKSLNAILQYHPEELQLPDDAQTAL